MLIAPGGFGKTTVLAEACRRAAAKRVPAAWITLDEGVDQGMLDTIIAYAFLAANVDVLSVLRTGDAALGHRHPRTALLIRALEAAGRPCVLAIDELERASEPGVVDLLNHLLRHAPPCLHLAIACRALPPGLDAIRSVVGPGQILTAEDLRFTKPDIARFFDLELSQTELAAVAAESAGWPIALQIRRNELAGRSATGIQTARHVVDNWIAGRFWDGFSEADRDLVRDIALFDWIDAALLDEVMEIPNVFNRLLRLPRLLGLLLPVGAQASEVYRLHPLLREHCAEQQRRENPARCRRLHRRLARALARRGEIIEAVRYAAKAQDATLAGAILLEAGGVQFWLREGATRMAAADRFIADPGADPRLAMVRCISLLRDGRLGEACRTFASTPSRPGDAAFEIDRLLVRGALAINGCQPVDAEEARAMTADALRIVALPTTRALVQGALWFGMSAYLDQRANFDDAVALAHRARNLVLGRSAYLNLVVDSHLGQVAMARGRVREARRRYRNAQRLARAHFLSHPRMIINVELLTRELALERNRLHGGDPRHIAREACAGGRHFSHYAAAAELATQLALDDGGVDAALALLDQMWDRAHGAGLAGLDRLLGALRVSLLVEARRIDEAERTWLAAGLPVETAGCVDLETQNWREMEAVSCARIRLLAATDRLKDALALEQSLARKAADHDLRRTLMRTLALRLRLSHAMRDSATVRTAMAEYLALYARTDYARPLLRAGRAIWRELARFIDEHPGTPSALAAERLLAMGRDRVTVPPRLTAKEKDVLCRLETDRDKQIAAALGLTVHGVRYRVRSIFCKLGVRRRTDAVRRARALGILTRIG